MKIYEATFEGDRSKGIELELKNGNVMSVIHDGGGYGGDYIFWGGRIPRPWLSPGVKIPGARVRRLIYDTDLEHIHADLLNAAAKVVNKLSGEDKGIWPWWAEIAKVMSAMESIEKRGGRTWPTPTAGAHDRYMELLPMENGNGETIRGLAPLMVVCGFGFSGNVEITAGENPTVHRLRA